MTLRRVLPAVVVAIALAAAPAGAKKAPLIEDPKGDYPVPNGDIVSADITTVPTGKGKLLITMDVAAAPSTSTPYSYSVNFVVGDCSFSAVYYGHPFEGVFTTSGVGCQVDGETSLPEGNVKVSGTTITWTVPLTGDLKKGATATDITANAQPSGMASGGVVATLGDAASTDKSYKIGS